MYLDLTSQWKNPENGVINGSEKDHISSKIKLDKLINKPVLKMQILDILTYLPDDILTKVDRTSMAVSLETRVPFLDHRIIESAITLPNSLKIRNGKGKYILRKILSNYIPSKLINRPKQGFAVPIGSWLNGPLKDWAENLLSEKKLLDNNFLNASEVRKYWNEHKQGKINRQNQLWGPLMFQAWLDHYNF